MILVENHINLQVEHHFAMEEHRFEMGEHRLRFN